MRLVLFSMVATHESKPLAVEEESKAREVLRKRLYGQWFTKTLGSSESPLPIPMLQHRLVPRSDGNEERSLLTAPIHRGQARLWRTTKAEESCLAVYTTLS